MTGWGQAGRRGRAIGGTGSAREHVHGAVLREQHDGVCLTTVGLAAGEVKREELAVKRPAGAPVPTSALSLLPACPRSGVFRPKNAGISGQTGVKVWFRPKNAGISGRMMEKKEFRPENARISGRNCIFGLVPEKRRPKWCR